MRRRQEIGEAVLNPSKCVHFRWTQGGVRVSFAVSLTATCLTNIISRSGVGNAVCETVRLTIDGRYERQRTVPMGTETSRAICRLGAMVRFHFDVREDGTY